MNESFRVGRAFGLGFSIYFKNFLPFALLTILVSSPEILYLMAEMSDWNGEASLSRLLDFQGFAIKLTLIGLGCGVLVISTVAYGVVMELKGQHAPIGATLAKGFSRFFHVIGVALLLGVILIVPLFVVGLMVASMGTFGQVLGQCVLGLIYAVFIAAIPAAVIERTGPASSLARSSELTQGKRGGIFAMLVLVLLAKFACTEILGSVLLDQDALRADPSKVWSMLKTIMWAGIALDLVFSMLMAVLASVTYYLLRAEKEGTSADELAAVFD